ncbi:hypothetical protein [Aquimarina sp. 2201CG5-10]|uniref:hypothetical protein n=1 Tax=Aquimarina callyspongiae TaxID=3098150 RepID=UPI002AB3C976|nr:hypothetical protein [Aquimarina sp. 2201CG5-10]MDY8134305.1 hypothetical protein [Aquimarina sp. 2201CG5-10]
MKKWIVLGTCILGMLSLTAFTTNSETHSIFENKQDITAIINKNTTEKELEDLKQFFSENGIELIINKIEFNESNEITSLTIILKKGKSKSKYSSSSDEPISDIELGYKNDNLYITNSGMFDIMAWKNQSGFSFRDFDMDSIMKKHSFAFNFDFDKDQDSLFFNGKHFDMNKLKDQIKKSFVFEKGEDGNFIINGQQFYPFQNFGSKQFNFVDDPDIEKLIIIDGKESDFKTLDELAKSDKLEAVDFLKPTTAISIYGDKAKDGAIIATTKKK